MDIVNLKGYLGCIGMTLREFCAHIGKNENYISRIIHGHTLPGKKTAELIYNATNGIIKLKVVPKKKRAPLKKKVKSEEKKESS